MVPINPRRRRAGLATAIVLAERGVRGIELVARELPGETSEGAGSVWRPVFYEGDRDGKQVRLCQCHQLGMRSQRSSVQLLNTTRGCHSLLSTRGSLLIKHTHSQARTRALLHSLDTRWQTALAHPLCCDTHHRKSLATWRRLSAMSSRPETGVSWCRGTELYTAASLPRPEWHTVVGEYSVVEGAGAAGAAATTGACVHARIKIKNRAQHAHPSTHML